MNDFSGTLGFTEAECAASRILKKIGRDWFKPVTYEDMKDLHEQGGFLYLISCNLLQYGHPSYGLKQWFVTEDLLIRLGILQGRAPTFITLNGSFLSALKEPKKKGTKKKN